MASTRILTGYHETNQGLKSRWKQSVFTEKWFRGTHLVQNLKWNYTLSMVSRHWENLILEKSCFWNNTKITRPILDLVLFWNCYKMRFLKSCHFAAPWSTLGHCQGSRSIHLMLIIAFYLFDSNVNGSLVIG